LTWKIPRRFFRVPFPFWYQGKHKRDGRFYADNVLELRKLVRDTWQQWLQTNSLNKLFGTLDRILPLIKEANGRNDYELPHPKP